MWYPSMIVDRDFHSHDVILGPLSINQQTIARIDELLVVHVGTTT